MALQVVQVAQEAKATEVAKVGRRDHYIRNPKRLLGLATHKRTVKKWLTREN